jgi:hypothetical protein
MIGIQSAQYDKRGMIICLYKQTNGSIRYIQKAAVAGEAAQVKGDGYEDGAGIPISGLSPGPHLESTAGPVRLADAAVA